MQSSGGVSAKAGGVHIVVTYIKLGLIERSMKEKTRKRENEKMRKHLFRPEILKASRPLLSAENPSNFPRSES